LLSVCVTTGGFEVQAEKEIVKTKDNKNKKIVLIRGINLIFVDFGKEKYLFSHGVRCYCRFKPYFYNKPAILEIQLRCQARFYLK
jgi:hypothetical protein